MSDAQGRVVATAATVGGDVSTALSAFESALLSKADLMNLPSQGVLVALSQRLQVLNNMDGAMAALPAEKRKQAMYLSKFMMAVSAGLFDAALNYLWDETIGELRKRIINYDLNYFFDLAVTVPEKRKELQGPDDLVKLTDDELIKAAARIGFISPVGQQQLDLVRFMRNHASAAHPNQHELQPFALLGYMETCIREVIMLPESATMVETSRLLANIRTTTLNSADAATSASLFSGLRDDQTETLARGLFGLYVAPTSTPTTRDNIRLLLPHLWPAVKDEVKYSFGTRYARYRANLDTQQSDFAREFLESVGGASFLPEDVRSVDIDRLLDRLHSAHNGWDNFYNEAPIAKELRDYVGSLPVPPGVRRKYVFGLIEVFLGNPYGVADAAEPVYASLLANMSPEDAAYALVLSTGPDFAALLASSKPRARLDLLLVVIEPKLVERQAKMLMQAMTEFTGPKSSMFLDSRLSELRRNVEAGL